VLPIVELSRLLAGHAMPRFVDICVSAGADSTLELNCSKCSSLTQAVDELRTRRVLAGGVRNAAGCVRQVSRISYLVRGYGA